MLQVRLLHCSPASETACPVQVADTTGEFGSLMGKVQGIVWDLTHAEATIECVWDPTLHLGSLGKGRNGNAGIAHAFVPYAHFSGSQGSQMHLQMQVQLHLHTISHSASAAKCSLASRTFVVCRMLSRLGHHP